MEYRCNFCKSAISKDDTFCQICGAVLPEIKEEQKDLIDTSNDAPDKKASISSNAAEQNRKTENMSVNFCRKCNSRLAMNDKFCSVCGTKVGDFSAHNTGVINEPPTIHKQRNNNKLFIMAAVIVFLFFLGMVSYAGARIWYQQSKSTTIDDNIDNYTNEDRKIKSKSDAENNNNMKSDQDADNRAYDRSLPDSAIESREEKIISDNEYLFPIDRQYITYDYLNTQSQYEVRLVLNELYARHGYTFENENNTKYFNSKSWYVSRHKTMKECEAEFNIYEKENQKTIVEYEKRNGWR